MTRKFISVLVALVALFTCAQAQKSVVYTLKNLQSKILFSSTVKGMDTTMVAERQMTISNNPTMNPIINGKKDSILNQVRTFTDTFNVSVMYPTYFYGKEIVVFRDTSGNIDSALAVSYIPVVVTPPFTKATEAIQSLSVGTTTATMLADFQSGFDTAYVEIRMSYGDTIFANPSPYLAYRDTILPVIGQANQIVTKPITLTLNSTSYPFSGKMRIWNSKGDTTSGKFSGITLPSLAPAMVSSPYAISATFDSISFTDQTVNNGLKCKHVAYLYDSSALSRPIDSIVLKFAESNTVIITKNTFSNLNSSSNYWINSGVMDTLFKVMYYSNRVFVQTVKMPTTFKLKIDSSHSAGWSTERTFSTVTVGSGHTGFASILMSKYGDQNNLLIIGSLKSFSSGINNFEFDLTNLVVGQKYAYTIYGYDTAYSNSYSAWVITDTFTFRRPVQGTGINLKEKSSSMVYSNPSLGWIKVNTSGPYEILNLSGTTLQKGILEEDAHVDVSTLPRGIFIVRTQKGAYKFAR